MINDYTLYPKNTCLDISGSEVIVGDAVTIDAMVVTQLEDNMVIVQIGHSKFIVAAGAVRLK